MIIDDAGASRVELETHQSSPATFAVEKPPAHRFNEAERQGVYRAIYDRRDVRSHFTSQPIADDVLARLLDAAHHAPSVGFMQPSSFIVIRRDDVRQQVHGIFECANRHAAESYAGESRTLYDNLKLAGILEAPINLCVMCDETNARGSGLGRQTMPETAAYSTVCAIQNLWLAARAEGIGCGWVSILDPTELRAVLRIPAEMKLIAYLCLGYVSEFHSQPELETRGWEQRAALADAIHFEQFGVADEEQKTELLRSIIRQETPEGEL